MSEVQQLLDEESKSTNSKEIRKNIWLLLDIITITFFATLCSSVPIAFFTREFIKIGGGYFNAAIILQIHPFTIGIMGCICGRIIPRTGYKTMIIFGVILESLAQIGFGLCTLIGNVTVFTILATICRALSGIGNAAAVATVYAIASSKFGSHAPFVVGLIESVASISYLLGPTVGALIFDIKHIMLLPIVTSGVAYLLSISRFAFFYKNTEKKKEHTTVKLSTLLHLLSHVAIVGPLFVLTSFSGIFGYFVPFFTVYTQHIGMAVVESGIAFGVFSGTYMIGNLICGKALSWQPKLAPAMMVLGCLGYAANFYCYTQTVIWVVYLGNLLNGLISSAVYLSVFTFSLAYVKKLEMDLSIEERINCLAGLWMSAFNLGKLPFAVVGGVMINATSIMQANIGIMIFCFALTLVTFTFNFYVHAKEKRQKN